jgi:acyl-CoA hydrolase
LELDPVSTTIETADRFTRLPDAQTLAETVAALEGRGFSVEVVDDFDAARAHVLARMPAGSSVMDYPSVTLEATGIAQAIAEGERYASARKTGFGLDRATQMHEIKALMLLPDFALGSVHAITRDGTLVMASALGSQIAAHAWSADKVIFVAGAQKLVPHFAAARERIFEHCLKLEDARAQEAYGAPSRVGKILEIHQEDPGRIHVVLIRQVVGF